MIKVLIPSDEEFWVYEKEVKVLYEKNQEKICDPNPFYFIIFQTLFFLFLLNGTVIGAIYFFMDDGKLYLNAFSRRKTFEENIECLKMTLSWFLPPIYAEAQNRASALCLLRVGFKRVEGNLFVYTRCN